MMDAIFLTHLGSPDFVEIIEEMQASEMLWNLPQRRTKSFFEPKWGNVAKFLSKTFRT